MTPEQADLFVLVGMLMVGVGAFGIIICIGRLFEPKNEDPYDF